MKKLSVLLFVLLFSSLSIFASTDKNRFRGMSLTLSSTGYHDSDSSNNDDWFLFESNTVSLALRKGQFSRNNRHVFGGGLKFQYNNSEQTVKLSATAIDFFEDLLDIEYEESVEKDFAIVRPFLRVEANFFYRYSLMDPEFVPHLKVWLEAEASVYRKWGIDGGHIGKPYTTGFNIMVHPVVSFEINETLSIETSVDVFYIHGKLYYQEQRTGNNKIGYTATVSTTNIKTIINAALNIGIIKRY